ncbi:uncharacterized protein [Procambarus clarkii]|uniref:uncharacterized protein isoform X3 n=1 Tax=Procambarus clarkii TaxID=6728 RepID=UPI003742407C
MFIIGIFSVICVMAAAGDESPSGSLTPSQTGDPKVQDFLNPQDPQGQDFLNPQDQDFLNPQDPQVQDFLDPQDPQVQDFLDRQDQDLLDAQDHDFFDPEDTQDPPVQYFDDSPVQNSTVQDILDFPDNQLLASPDRDLLPDPHDMLEPDDPEHDDKPRKILCAIPPMASLGFLKLCVAFASLIWIYMLLVTISRICRRKQRAKKARARTKTTTPTVTQGEQRGIKDVPYDKQMVDQNGTQQVDQYGTQPVDQNGTQPMNQSFPLLDNQTCPPDFQRGDQTLAYNIQSVAQSMPVGLTMTQTELYDVAGGSQSRSSDVPGLAQPRSSDVSSDVPGLAQPRSSDVSSDVPGLAQPRSSDVSSDVPGLAQPRSSNVPRASPPRSSDVPGVSQPRSIDVSGASQPRSSDVPYVSISSEVPYVPVPHYVTYTSRSRTDDVPFASQSQIISISRSTTSTRDAKTAPQTDWVTSYFTDEVTSASTLRGTSRGQSLGLYDLSGSVDISGSPQEVSLNSPSLSSPRIVPDTTQSLDIHSQPSWYKDLPTGPLPIDPLAKGHLDQGSLIHQRLREQLINAFNNIQRDENIQSIEIKISYLLRVTKP